MALKVRYQIFVKPNPVEAEEKGQSDPTKVLVTLDQTVFRQSLKFLFNPNPADVPG